MHVAARDRRHPDHRARASAELALRADGRDRHRRRHLRAGLLARLHARRRPARLVLRGPVAVHRGDARVRARRQPPADVRVVGDHGAVLVPADRVLVRARGPARRGDEGVPHHPRRRPRVPVRAVGRVGAGRVVRARPGHRVASRVGRRRGDPCGHRLPDRGDGQVGADRPARVAARRDGRPHARLGAHPRRDDGRGRRLPRGA